MRRAGWVGKSMALAGFTLLAACELPPAIPQVPAPPPRPDITPQSPESQAMVDYYARLQRGLLAQGLLRTDGGGPDVPFSARDLARNFQRIAFYQEYTDNGGRLVAQERGSRLHRWTQPVRLNVRYGASVPLENRTRDKAQITRYAARLARLTGLSISQVSTGGNFQVLILNEDERRASAPLLRQILPGISPAAVNEVVNMPRETYCLVFATDPQKDGTPEQAVAVIRGEHPDLLRTSCLHEEIAQGLGLSNDSPRARPSIFNDDEEFGLLTTHDEMLLRMLYDPRLRPGMTETEARPIILKIAAELTGGSV